MSGFVSIEEPLKEYLSLISIRSYESMASLKNHSIVKRSMDLEPIVCKREQSNISLFLFFRKLAE